MRLVRRDILRWPFSLSAAHRPGRPGAKHVEPTWRLVGLLAGTPEGCDAPPHVGLNGMDRVEGCHLTKQAPFSGSVVLHQFS